VLRQFIASRQPNGDLYFFKVNSNETSFLMLPVFIKDIALVGRAQNFTRLFLSGVALNM
jgi:hypothetical protein